MCDVLFWKDKHLLIANLNKNFNEAAEKCDSLSKNCCLLVGIQIWMYQEVFLAEFKFRYGMVLKVSWINEWTEESKRKEHTITGKNLIRLQMYGMRLCCDIISVQIGGNNFDLDS